MNRAATIPTAGMTTTQGPRVLVIGATSLYSTDTVPEKRTFWTRAISSLKPIAATPAQTPTRTA